MTSTDDLRAKFVEILSPAIEARAPYARVMIDMLVTAALAAREGWQLVPKIATQAMLDEVCCESPYPTIVARDDVMQGIWQDMLAAAPPAPQG